LTNHPPKVTALEGFELEVVGNVPLGYPASEESAEIEGLTPSPVRRDKPAGCIE